MTRNPPILAAAQLAYSSVGARKKPAIVIVTIALGLAAGVCGMIFFAVDFYMMEKAAWMFERLRTSSLFETGDHHPPYPPINTVELNLRRVAIAGLFGAEILLLVATAAAIANSPQSLRLLRGYMRSKIVLAVIAAVLGWRIFLPLVEMNFRPQLRDEATVQFSLFWMIWTATACACALVLYFLLLSRRVRKHFDPLISDEPAPS